MWTVRMDGMTTVMYVGSICWRGACWPGYVRMGTIVRYTVDGSNCSLDCFGSSVVSHTDDDGLPRVCFGYGDHDDYSI